MDKVDRTIPCVLNLCPRHAPRRVNEQQNVAASGLYLGLCAVSRPEGQLALFVKREQFSHLGVLIVAIFPWYSGTQLYRRGKPSALRVNEETTSCCTAALVKTNYSYLRAYRLLIVKSLLGSNAMIAPDQ
jgi:hypothetical protein